MHSGKLLRELLAAEHSKAQCDRIVKYIGRDKKRFAELMHLFLGDEYRITQRASWPLSYCVEAHPELIDPYFKPLLDNLAKKNVHGAVIRNTVRLLQDVEIPKRYQGRVMNICFDFIQSPETATAVRAFSFTVLQHLSRDYPDIRPELKLIIEEQWDRLTPGVRARARRVLDSMRPKRRTARSSDGSTKDI
jgi:hypothetical protein